MLTFNKLAEIFSKLDPGTRDLGFVFPLMDKDGNVTGLKALSGNTVLLCPMREMKDGVLGPEESVIVLAPQNFNLEDHVGNGQFITVGA